MTRKRHNRNTCFGCRLHALVEELYPGGPTNTQQLSEIMTGLVGCSAEMLTHTDKDGVKIFFFRVMENVAKLVGDDVIQPPLH